MHYTLDISGNEELMIDMEGLDELDLIVEYRATWDRLLEEREDFIDEIEILGVFWPDGRPVAEVLCKMIDPMLQGEKFNEAVREDQEFQIQEQRVERAIERRGL